SRARENASTEKQYKEVMKDGGVSFAEGRYVQARGEFHRALEMARAAGRNDWAARVLSNIAGCQFASHEYQPALESYLDARRMAEVLSEVETVAAIDANIASLHAQMGEIEAAIQWLQVSMRRSSGSATLPQMQIEMGSLVARQERLRLGGTAARGGSLRPAMP